MAKTVDKMFVWVIKDFYLQSVKCYSVPVVISDCKWRLCAVPSGNNGDHLSLFLEVVDHELLPSGWVRYVKLHVTLVNQLSQKLSIMEEKEGCFDGKSSSWGFPSMVSLSKLNDKNGGFLSSGDLIIVTEVDVLEVIGTLESLEKSLEADDHGNDLEDDLEAIGTFNSSEKSQEVSEHGSESNDLADDLEVKCKITDETAAGPKINQRPKRKIMLPRRYPD